MTSVRKVWNFSQRDLIRDGRVPDRRVCPLVSGVSPLPRRKPRRSSAEPSAGREEEPARDPAGRPSGAEMTSLCS